MTRDQVEMEKDMDRIKGKVNQIMNTITNMKRDEGLQQDTAVRNVILVFPSAS